MSRRWRSSRSARYDCSHLTVASRLTRRVELGGQEGMITNVLQIVGNDNVDLYVPDAFILSL